MVRAKQHFFQTLTVCIAALAVWFTTGSAAACSGCTGAAVLPESGDLPSNMVLFRYKMPSCRPLDGGIADAPRLYRLDGPVRVEVPLRTEKVSSTRPFPLAPIGAIWFIPDESLPVGTQLVLETPANPADPAGQLHQYQVTAPAPLPTELGTLQASLHRGTIRVSDNRGGCSQEADLSYADLTVALAPSARPYAELFQYFIFVDGKPFPYFKENVLSVKPSLPQGSDRLYISCAQPIDLRPYDTPTPGVHRVRFSADLRDLTLETPEIEVELVCAGAAPDAAVPPVTSMVDAGTTAQGPLATDTSSITSADDGCQLSPARAAHKSLPLWVLVLGLALVSRRRRRPLV